jgi:hypothetical protein
MIVGLFHALYFNSPHTCWWHTILGCPIAHCPIDLRLYQRVGKEIGTRKAGPDKITTVRVPFSFPPGDQNMLHRAPPTWLRRRFRISVRGLSVVVLIIGAGLGWIVHPARIQREAVAAIRKDGGAALYDWEWKNGAFQRDGKPSAPKWLVDSLGVDYFGHAVCVSVRQPGSTSTLSNVGRLSRLEHLSLHGPFVTDSGLAHLKGLTDLSHLNIGDSEVDCSTTITHIGTARVTDAGMPYLKGLTKLSFLDLNGTQVSDTGLENLAGLSKLEVLRLGDTLVTDSGLAHLKRMTKLKGLELGGSAVTDAGLVHLEVLIDLSYLSIRDTQTTDAGLSHLKGLTKLRMLDLSETRITDAGLAHLKGLIKLFDLDLRGTQVSLAAVRELQLMLARSISVQLGPKNGTPPVHSPAGPLRGVKFGVRRVEGVGLQQVKSCPASGSLQPVAIGAMVAETKPSEPSRQVPLTNAEKEEIRVSSCFSAKKELTPFIPR